MKKRDAAKAALTACAVLFIGIFTLSTAASGQGWDWITANQVTVTWDAVTTLLNGDPIPEGDEVAYKLWLSNQRTDPEKTNPAFVGGTAETQFTLTLGVEGRYLAGVSAVRLIDGEEVGESEACWSDDAECAPVPFGLRWHVPPGRVRGLSVLGQ